MQLNSLGGSHMITRETFRRGFWAFVFVFSTLVPLISPPAYGQVVGATLSGTITDASGAAVPQGSITVKNVATGIGVSASSNASGFYVVPNLIPGPYTVTVSAAGFRTEVRAGIELTVGAQQALNIALQVGEVSQTVEVTGEAP